MTANQSPVVLGKLGAPYGIKGWIKVISYTDDPEGIFAYRPWLLEIKGQWQEVEVVEYRRQNKGLNVKLKNVDDRDAAVALTHCHIGVVESALPSLDNDEFYWRELIGMEVLNEQGYHLGKVDDLFETGSNDVLVVTANANDAFGQKERLLPFLLDSTIKQVNRQDRKIIVDWDPSF